MHIARCRVLRPWIALGLLSVAATGLAGEPKESLSGRDGVFAAWASPSVADTHVFFKSREGATALARHCRAQLPVHLLPQGTPFTCRVEFLPPAEAGHEGGGLRLSVKGPGSKPDHWVYGLFTVSSPHHVRWTERAATAAEQSAVRALLATDTKLSRTVTGRAVGSARAVAAAEGAHPGRGPGQAGGGCVLRSTAAPCFPGGRGVGAPPRRTARPAEAVRRCRRRRPAGGDHGHRVRRHLCPAVDVLAAPGIARRTGRALSGQR